MWFWKNTFHNLTAIQHSAFICDKNGFLHVLRPTTDERFPCIHVFTFVELHRNVSLHIMSGIKLHIARSHTHTRHNLWKSVQIWQRTMSCNIIICISIKDLKHFLICYIFLILVMVMLPFTSELWLLSFYPNLFLSLSMVCRSKSDKKS